MTSDVVNNQKHWLIKSSTRVLGPFTTGEVAELLRTRQISIIDEIRLPSGRWQYVRENKIFMDIVKNIREEQDSQADLTMTQSIAQYSSITRTDATGPVSDDLTPPPSPTEKVPAVPGGMKDVTPLGNKAGGTSVSTVTKTYGASADSRLQEKIRQKSNLFRWGLIGATLAVIGLVFFGLQQKEKAQGLGYEELVSQAVRYKNLGLYEKSLQFYSRAAKLRMPDTETQTQMAPVLISEDRQSLVGRRILEAALVKEGANRAEILDSYLGIAVSYMLDGDLKQAEDVLQKAIGYEPFNVSALLNLAIIQQKKGNYPEAEEGFQNIFKKNPQTVIALLGQAVATIEQAKRSSDTRNLLALIGDLKLSAQRSIYLRQELLLFVVYAQSLLGDVDGLNQAVVQFLSQPSGQSKNYTHPLTIEWRFAQWDYLEKYCGEIYQKQNPHPEMKALRAVCLMEVNRDAESGKLLQEALAEAPKDPFVLTTQASYLAKINKLPEALAVLKVPELQSLPLKNLLMGEVCIRAQDVSCALNAFKQVHSRDPQNVLALFGLAWALHKKDRAKAYEYVRSGLLIEPNFLPLLELRDQLELE